jgi:hypothetical protein
VSQEHAHALLHRLEELLNTHTDGNIQTPAQQLSEQALQRYREAVSSWLADVQSADIQPQPNYASGRPKRGRPAKG